MKESFLDERTFRVPIHLYKYVLQKGSSGNNIHVLLLWTRKSSSVAAINHSFFVPHLFLLVLFPMGKIHNTLVVWLNLPPLIIKPGKWFCWFGFLMVVVLESRLGRQTPNLWFFKVDISQIILWEFQKEGKGCGQAKIKEARTPPLLVVAFGP